MLCHWILFLSLSFDDMVVQPTCHVVRSFFFPSYLMMQCATAMLSILFLYHFLLFDKIVYMCICTSVFIFYEYYQFQFITGVKENKLIKALEVFLIALSDFMSSLWLLQDAWVGFGCSLECFGYSLECFGYSLGCFVMFFAML